MLYQHIRDFFNTRDVLEVETPLLCQHGVTDPYIDSLQSNGRFLQTSPEYAMKRLLASGSGDIYQICKAFRQDEAGHLHNPEFTLLEWYRTGYDHHQLMGEVEQLVSEALALPTFKRFSYADCFQQLLSIDPFNCDVDQLQQLAQQHNIHCQANSMPNTVDDWLQLLLSYCIEPQLAKLGPTFIYDFPASQSALAQLDPNNPTIAQRFELYINGVELANGFHELTDAQQQLQRFEINNQLRKQMNKPAIHIDQYLIDALHHGLPACAGVALGIDRLLMLQSNSQKIGDILSFDWSHA